jgi:lipopolysaccharide biosynthesis protein
MQDVCLFAHFDKDARVDDYVLWYLRKIKELGFSTVFISTSLLPQSEIERVQPYCFEVILRENSGLDFGSWSMGFAKHCGAIHGRLLLANDSVYGPTGNLEVALNRLTAAKADFYGFVESFEIAPHLQSWFLLFEPWVVRHAAFKSVLAQPFSAMTKRRIVENGEIGLSRRLVGSGFRYNALYQIDGAGLAARWLHASPMLFLWRELLCDVGIPFLKVQLLRDRPAGVEDVTVILRVAKDRDPEFCALVESHLSRMNPGALPNQARSFDLWRSIRHQRLALLRRGYHLSQGNRRLPEIWNLMKLMPFVVVQRALQMLRALRIIQLDRV